MIVLYLLGPYPFGYDPSAYDLLMFALGSFVIISMLILYYNKIPKSKHAITALENPIYQSKDILLQINSNELTDFGVKETTSKWVKTFVYLTILLLVFFPLNIV